MCHARVPLLVLIGLVLAGLANAETDNTNWGMQLRLIPDAEMSDSDHERVYRDGTGRLWVKGGRDWRNPLCTYVNGKWFSVGTDGPEGVSPLDISELRYGPDGSILARLTMRGRDAEDRTVQVRGTTYKEVPSSSIFSEQFYLFADHSGRAWGCGDNPEDVLIPVDGKQIQVSALRMKAEEYPQLCNGMRGLDGIVKDRKGRYWIPFTRTPFADSSEFWQHQNAIQPLYVIAPPTEVNGVQDIKIDLLDAVTSISFEGGNPGLYEDDWNGVDLRRRVHICPKNDDVMWLVIPQRGLYEVEVETLRARKVPPPEGMGGLESFSCVNTRGGLLIVDGNTLWRYRNDQWDKALDPFVREIVGPYDIPCVDKRFVVDTTSGVWLDTRNGVFLQHDPHFWFLPADGSQPVVLSWRADRSLSRIKCLFSRGEDGLTVVRDDFSVIELTGADLLGLNAKPVNPPSFSSVRSVIQDRAGNVYGQFKEKPGVLVKWDGRTWKDLQVPMLALDPKDMRADPTVCLDTRDRIWIARKGPAQAASPCFVLDTASETWTRHASYFDALETTLDKPLDAKDSAESFAEPQYGPDKTMALCLGEYVFCFDGTKWDGWRAGEITGGAPLDSAYFSESGKFTVQEREMVAHELQPDGQWLSVARNKPPRIDKTLRPPQLPKKYKATCVAFDRLGAFWFLDIDGVLHKTLFERVAEVSRETVDLPVFSFGSGMMAVDRDGNALLEEHNEEADPPYSYWTISPGGPLPETRAAVRDIVGDAAEFELSAEHPEAVFFAYRCDDGAWTEHAGGTSLTLRGLPAGRHRVEVYAFDENLACDATPVVLDFAIGEDFADIDNLIAQVIEGSGGTREKAAMTLACMGPDALVKLRKALEGASGDAAWWLNATIQRIEDKIKDKGAEADEPPVTQ